MAYPTQGICHPCRHIIAVLALGIGSQLSQAVLAREVLMVFQGNELSIGIALASWLLWGGLGGLLGARLASRTGKPLSASVVIGLSLLVIQPFTLALLRGMRGFFNVLPGENLSLADTLAGGVPAMAPACILWGAQFVFLAAIWRRYGPAADPRRGPVHTYAVEATGNLLGGAIFSLFLVHWLDPLSCIVLSGALVAAAPLILLPRRAAAGLPLLLVIFLFSPLGRLDHLLHQAQWRMRDPERQLVAVARSRYGRIDITRYGSQYGFFQSGSLVFSTGVEESADFAMEEQEAAILAHMALTQHPKPRKIMLIGGGLRGVLREATAHPVEAIDYVELDPALVKSAIPFLPDRTREALADPRVRLLTGDGRLAVKSGGQKYDVIVVDVPDPTTAALNRYYTLEFFREAKRRLETGGILVIGVSSTAGLRDLYAANRNSTIHHTLSRVFPETLPVGERHLLYFACREPNLLTADPRLLRTRYLEREVTSKAFSDRHFFTLLQPEQVRRVNWILRRHGRTREAVFQSPPGAPLTPPELAEQIRQETELPPVAERYFINTDFQPIGYLHSLLFWQRQGRGREDRILPAILRINPGWPALFVILALFGAILPRLAGKPPAAGRKASLRFSVLTTGLATMAGQMSLLFAFQSQYGFVYEMIGLIVALFMGGLAAGAALCRPRRGWRGLAFLQLVIAAWALIMAFGLPVVARLASPSAILLLFAAATSLAGFWNGMNFPLSLACAADTENDNLDFATGAIYGTELIGACLGAILAGAIIIPVLGIAACLQFSAALNLSAFLAIVINLWTFPKGPRNLTLA